jgi:DNA-binding NtrC family response regulator/methyl-accepting chemotaxis protein
LVAKFAAWLKQAPEKIFLFHRVNIGLRLTLGFVFIILAMFVGNAILVWQFDRARAQAERLSGVDQELIAVLQAHTNLMSFYERLDLLAQSQNTDLLVSEADALRSALAEDSRRSRTALSRLPPEVHLDPTVLPALVAIQDALPSQLEAVTVLAQSGQWDAVRLRLAKQVRALESKSSALVESIDREVGEERAEAVLNIRQAQRRILLVAPITASLTLLFAAFLGLTITGSITKPLGRLMEASKALGRSEFHHQVPIVGSDELAHLGRTFNATAGTLRNLYETLSTKEAYLVEAQRLSQTGSFGWNPSNGELTWSDETFRIMEYSQTDMPTIEMILQRTHPEDVSAVQQLLDRVSRSATNWEIEHRLLMPNGSVKYIRAVGHAFRNSSGQPGFVGAIMDVTATTKALKEVQSLKDQLDKENIALREEVDKVSMYEEIVGSSNALRKVLTQVTKVALADTTVLILGDTGTGKEMVARAIHRRSSRSARAFIRVNCAAIPPTLIASELFGHEKGSFTGATQRRLGRFELANGGTLFLDEVGELPAETQSSLLRVLQEREFERVGGTQSVSVDVRILSATNRDLKAAVQAGRFREDLYYRLSVFPIHMPSLQERVDDIPLLLEYFLERYAKKTGKKIRGIEKKTLEMFQAYKWPGNIRELQNVIERAVILCDGDTFSVDEMWLTRDPAPASPTMDSPVRRLGRLLPDEEREIIEAALAGSGGRISGPKGAAAQLGIPRQTLEAKIVNLGINKHKFKSA